MEAITFPRDVCRDFSRACTKEWLETNGLGGYASSTVCLANTRRYHGLLVTANEPPSRRHVLLSSLEDGIEVDGQKFHLSNHYYPGTVFPKGYEYLIEYRADPFPTFVYRIGDTWLEKVLFLVQGENTLGVVYRLLGNDLPVKLFVRPLTAFRGVTQLTDENPGLDPAVHTARGEIRVQPYPSLPSLYFYHDAVVVEKNGYWYKSFEYPDEESEEMGYREDIFSPFSLLYSFSSCDEVFLVVTTDPKQGWNFQEAFSGEKERREKIAENLPAKERAWGLLWQTAEGFIAYPRDGKGTLVAGYPFLPDLTRDALLSLHGLLLVRGKYEEAKTLLFSVARSIKGGLLPDCLSGAKPEEAYRAADIPLIFAEAVFDYLGYSDDVETVEKELYPAIRKIFRAYREGIPGVLRTDEDGLIEIAGPGVMRTWMNAAVEGVPVTPRDGKTVEINALWHNALMILRELGGRFGNPKLAEECSDLAGKAKEAFNRLFWCEEKGYLFDRVKRGECDGSLRPNQIFAVSLSFPALDPSRWKKIVEACEKELFTPFGLRTLEPGNADYAGRCEGNEAEKNKALHQGTVWPWLLGPFFTAFLRAFGDSRELKSKFRESIAPLLAHLEDFGLGSISEMFDGAPPHFPRGSISHALAVAEFLRIYEVLKASEIPPPRPKEIILR